MIDLSIIIVNWNTEKLLEKCLQSVLKHVNNLNFEIIVVDNNSSDNSVEMVKNSFPEVILIKNNSNLGFAKANNIAIENSAGKTILLLNSDTEIFDNSVYKLYEFLNNNNLIGACGGKLLYPNGDLQLSYGNFPSFLRILWITISGLLNIGFNRKPLGIVPYGVEKPIQVDYVVGAALMIKREILDKVGLLDEYFFAYFEETDLCFRIKKAGFQIWFNPDSQITHVFGGSLDPSSINKFKIFTESQFKYFKKNLGYYSHIKYYFILKLIINMLKEYVFNNKSKVDEYKKKYEIIKNIKL